MSGYQVLLTWDEEDRIYVARAPDLPGCSAHGATREKAVKSIREAIDFWIETAREDGEAVPEPRRYDLVAA